MRDYQRRTSKYILPRTIYNQTIWQIRDYYRLKELAEAILEESPPPADGQPKGNSTGDLIASKAIRRERAISIIKIIDEEKSCIPKEYREGVWDNIIHGAAYPKTADRSTFGRYKSKFVYEVARRIFLL